MQDDLEINNIADLYRNFNDGVFSQTKILVELILTYPITSNEGERSFSQLKRLLTSLRTNMTEGRICNLARMAMHPARLNSLNNEDIIEAFKEAQPRRLVFQTICQDNNNESEGSICSSFFTFILLLTLYIAQTVSIFLLKIQYLCKLYNSFLITSIGMVCSSVHINHFPLPKRLHLFFNLFKRDSL